MEIGQFFMKKGDVLLVKFMCNKLIERKLKKMDEEIFKQEKEKLKDIVKKINKEENNLEQYLSSADMNYDLENIAQAQFVSSQLRKLENIKSNT